MRNIWTIITLIPEYRGRILIVLLASTMIGLSGTAAPFIFRLIVNTVSDLNSHRMTLPDATIAAQWIVASFVCLRLVVVGATYLLERETSSLQLSTLESLRRRVLEKLTNMSLDYYEATHVGDIMERFSNIPAINTWLFQLSDGALSNILQLGFATTVVLIKAPVVGLIMLFVVPLNVCASLFESHNNGGLRRKQGVLIGKMSGLISEMASQISTIRGFAGERVVKNRYEEIQQSWRANLLTIKGRQRHLNLAAGLANMLAIVLSVVVVTNGALSGLYTPGDVLLILALSHGLVTTITPISQFIILTGDIEGLAEKLVFLFNVPKASADLPCSVDAGPISSIEFKDVSFTYPGKTEPALCKISFCLTKGKKLGLLGPSGSGKTTIIKLLLRHYEPDSGQILINGKDISQYRQNSLRAQIGLVPQDLALFNDTIANNIRFSQPSAVMSDIVEAAKSSRASVFIDQLPMGLNTLVGERGIKLSGGERQRIAIARALLRKPSLIVLDEATSALDSESEALIQEGLGKLMGGRTSIVIAHRLSTVANADVIIVVKNGSIVEQGTHESLLRMEHGLYSYLYGLQTSAASNV